MAAVQVVQPLEQAVQRAQHVAHQAGGIEAAQAGHRLAQQGAEVPGAPALAPGGPGGLQHPGGRVPVRIEMEGASAFRAPGGSPGAHQGGVLDEGLLAVRALEVYQGIGDSHGQLLISARYAGRQG